tara:strand:+ start:119 stop:898 length:780 start_codon:yes stop_codon:yes gene_type:complete
MADQKAIDSSSEQIARMVDSARDDLVRDLLALANQKINPATGVKTFKRLADDIPAFTSFILDFDVEGTVKNKLQKALKIYADAHRGVLETTIGFGKINPKALSSFVSLNEEVFNNSIIRVMSGQLKNQLVNGVSAGLTADMIIERVSQSSISNAQMQTLVKTTLNTYSRTITNQMMKNAPADTKYVYIGPVDDRTRIECLDYASAGELTEAEIISNGWSASLIDGGGFNCRHKWEIASTEGKGFSEQSKVEGQREKNAR